MADLWLVNTEDDQSAADVRNAIKENAGSPVTIVLKVDLPPVGSNWAGMFPSNKSKKWAEWLNRFWKPGI
jgi:hypothetical protein